MADTDAQPGRVSESLQLVAPEAGAGVVGPAGVGGDRQCAGVRIALRAEVLPPADDRVDGELGGIAGDPDADPALVRRQIVDAVRDRMSELLVLEVMTANLDRPALG